MVTSAIIAKLDICQTSSQLNIHGKEYVAKKLVDIGEGPGEVPIHRAAALLIADLIRLKRMEHFGNQFKSLAIQQGIQITSA